MKKNTVWGKIGRRLLWYAITLGVLFFLFVLAVSIPKYKVRENLLESAKYLLTEEELFYQLREGDRRTEIHNYADATTLNILYSIDGKNRVKEIIQSPMYTNKATLEQSMLELLEERITWEYRADTLYDRYWHGMVLVLRPLLLLFNLQQIRWIFLGALGISMVAVSIMLWKRQQRLAVVLLWLLAMWVQLPMMALCIEYFPVVMIMFLIAVAMLHWEENREKILGLCIVSGTCVAFFDFLTTETLAFVIPLALVYGIWEHKNTIKKWKEELAYVLTAGGLWGSAYVMTYLIKWSLSSVVYGGERFSAALVQLAGRQGNTVTSLAIDSLSQGTISAEALQNAGGTILPQFLSAIVINVRLLLGLSGKITLEQLALILFFAGFVLTAVIHLFRKPGQAGAFPYILFLLGIIPLARMMVLNNHSIEHCFFVYRSLYGTIFCLMAGVWQFFDWNFLRRRMKR